MAKRVADKSKRQVKSDKSNSRYKNFDFQKSLGISFEKNRIKRGYSIDRVYLEGERLSRATISHIDRGLINAQIGTLKRYADIIGVPLWQIIKEAQDKRLK